MIEESRRRNHRMGSSLTEHLLDFVGSSIASIIATAVDGLIYAALLFFAAGYFSVGYAAALGAFVGGMIHYSLSRFWVFERFQAPIAKSATTYFGMSWLAAVIHGLLTNFIAAIWGASIAWFISKGIVWVFWTYPVSRFVVFGGFGEETSSS